MYKKDIVPNRWILQPVCFGKKYRITMSTLQELVLEKLK